VTQLLPARAKTKFAALKEECTNAQTLVTSLVNRTTEQFKALSFLQKDDPKLADIEFEISRLRAAQSKAQSRFESLSTLLANIRRYLTEDVKPHQQLSDIKPPKLKERTGQSWFDRIDSTRMEISRVAAEIKDVTKAELPTDELHAQCAKYVQAAAMRARPIVKASHDGFRVDWGDQRTVASSPLTMPDYLAVMFPAEMTELLYNIAADRPAPKLVMTPSQRAEKLLELKVSLLQLERMEEALVSEAEIVTGVFVDRRPLANPLAILGLTLERAEPAKAAVA